MTAGVIAAGHPRSARTGADVLHEGGTAHDAAIAAIAMACVCEPVLCSPGGGGFATLRNGADGAVTVIDGFLQTPLRRSAAADPVRSVVADFGTATQPFQIGPATTATPGWYAGVDAIHRAGATMSLCDLFAPAIRAARDGIVISQFQHRLSTIVRPILVASRPAAELYVPTGELLPAGGVLRNPGLADALEILATEGFAGSAVGDVCVTQQDGRGHLTAADLATYRVVERAPLTMRVGTSTVHLNPLPAAGGLLVAHTLDQLTSTDPVVVARALMRTGDARRAAGDRLAALDPTVFRTRGTTQVSVVDGDGNAVAVTMSNGEGNGELVPGFGFMLNNVLGEEDVNPAGPLGWPEAQRLSSMMCPTIIELDGDTAGGVVALGSGGSNRIRSAIAQVVARLCLDGEEPRAAVDAPRLHVEGAHLDFEDRMPAAVRDALTSRFHDHLAWPRPDMFFGGVHAAWRAADGGLGGVGDARRDGAAIVVA